MPGQLTRQVLRRGERRQGVRREVTTPKELQPLTRRNAIAALGAGSCALVAGCAPHQVAAAVAAAPQATATHPQGAPDMPFAKALTGTHTALPLSFKPSALNGLSEKMLVSHHDNNYGGA